MQVKCLDERGCSMVISEVSFYRVSTCIRYCFIIVPLYILTAQLCETVNHVYTIVFMTIV